MPLVACYRGKVAENPEPANRNFTYIRTNVCVPACVSVVYIPNLPLYAAKQLLISRMIMSSTDLELREVLSENFFIVQIIHLPTLATLNEKMVSLEQINGTKGFPILSLFTDTASYVATAIENIKTNPHIESLILGRQFLTHFFDNSLSWHQHIEFSGTFLTMPALKTLILNNSGWLPPVFESLQRYLTDPKCQIETLIINSGLTTKEINKLAICFQNSSSLVHYYGAAEATLQPKLNEKILNRDSSLTLSV